MSNFKLKACAFLLAAWVVIIPNSALCADVAVGGDMTRYTVEHPGDNGDDLNADNPRALAINEVWEVPQTDSANGAGALGLGVIAAAAGLGLGIAVKKGREEEDD